jgi:hypothetical protein
MKITHLLYWAVRGLAALILLQTLYFKFSASEESVYIFTTVGLEPWGRIGIGILELVAAVLLLINPTAWIGAVLSAGLMAGAIVMHVTMLGIEVKGDDGYLFVLALTVFICSVFVLWVNRRRVFQFLKVN